MRSDPEQSPRFASCKQKFKGFFSGFFNRARTIFSNHMAKYQQITPAPPIEFRMKFGSSVVEALKKSSARNSNENIRFSDDRKFPQKNQNKSFLTNLKKLEEKVGSLGLSVCLSAILVGWKENTEPHWHFSNIKVEFFCLDGWFMMPFASFLYQRETIFTNHYFFLLT